MSTACGGARRRPSRPTPISARPVASPAGRSPATSPTWPAPWLCSAADRRSHDSSHAGNDYKKEMSSLRPTPPARRNGWLSRLAGWSYDHRRRVLFIWIGVLVVTSVVSGIIGSNYENRFSGGNSESQRAQDFLAARFPQAAGDSADIVFHADEPLTSAAAKSDIAAVVDTVRRLPHVSGVVSPYDQPDAQISRIDPTIGFARVQFDQETVDLDKSTVQAVVDAAEAARNDGLQVELGGQPIAKVVQAQLGPSELIGIAAA